MTIQIKKLQDFWAELLVDIQPITAVLMILWFVVMIAVPISIWTIGPKTIPVTMLLGTVCQAAVALSVLIPIWGWQRALITFAGVGVMGWAAEYIGTATGLPFGRYFYTDLLQPQIGHVPLLVPVAWFILLPACWRLAEMIGGPEMNRWVAALISACGMVAWDLLLDPQMVNWGFWVWQDVPAISWFGIPFLNYFGWFLTAFLMTLILRPPSLRQTGIVLWLVFAITWFLETFGLLFFWGLAGPAMGGGFVMGGLMVWSFRSEYKQS